MTTADPTKPAPLQLGGSTVNAFDDDASYESLGSSIPEFITLNVILPDGSVNTTEVSSSKPMIDLAVQLTAANHLSPTNHTLALYHPETGRPIEYKASQMIGSFHVDTVYVVNKKAGKDKMKTRPVSSAGAPPFEITNRLTVNLPKNQKMVLRIKPQSTLAEIFKMVCAERNLDPYKHELRHPTQPDMALNMANSLASYRINEITLVSVSDSESDVVTSSTAKTHSIYDTHWTYTNSMPRKRADVQPASCGSDQPQPTYMPGMMEKKKKKGFLSIFSRKKEGKFNLSEATYNATTTSNQPPAYEQPQVMSNGSKLQTDVTQRPNSKLRTSATSVQSSTTSVESSAESSRMSTVSLDGMMSLPKRSRKNRPAPAPPTNRPLSINTEVLHHGHAVHSRDSSHSSGFDEISVSPLTSPGNVPGKTTDSVKTKDIPSTIASVDSSDGVADGQTIHCVVDEDRVVCSSAASTASRTSSLSTGGDNSPSSMQRNRKKRRAPPPPQGAPKPSSSDSSLKLTSSGSPLTSSASQSPDQSGKAARSTNQPDTERMFDTRELQMAIAEELKKDVSCDSYTSDVPQDSPRIMETEEAYQSAGVHNKQTPVTLERQKSDVAVFVEQMTELTADVEQMTELTADVEQMTELTADVEQMTEVMADVEQDGARSITKMQSVDGAELNHPNTIKGGTSAMVNTKEETRCAVSDTQHLADVLSEERDQIVQTQSNICTETSCDGVTLHDTGISEQQMEHILVEGASALDTKPETVTPSPTPLNAVMTSPTSVSATTSELISAELVHSSADVGSVGENKSEQNDLNSSAAVMPMEDNATVSLEKLPEQHVVTTSEITCRNMDAAHSDSSPEGSLSNLNIDDMLSDSEDGADVLPGSNEPVQLVKKKIIPAFTLNLEDEGEVNDEVTHKQDNEQYTEVITGEMTSIIKVEHYEAGLSTDTMTNQDRSSVTESTIEDSQTNFRSHKPSELDHVTRITVNLDHLQEGHWKDSCSGISPIRFSGRCATELSEEISFDDIDVTYVPPSEANVAITGEYEQQTLTDKTDALHQESSPDDTQRQVHDPVGFTEDIAENEDMSAAPSDMSAPPNDTSAPTSDTSAPTSDMSAPTSDMSAPTSDMSAPQNGMSAPQNGMSLLSIVSEVKSKSDVRQHTSPVELNPDTEAIRGEIMEHTEMVSTESSSTPPVFKSLRDAYKNKSEQESHMLIIPKPEPFTLPLEANISKDAPDVSLSVIHDSKIPSGENKAKPVNFHVQPVIYKKESLAVSRKAHRMAITESDEKKAVSDDCSNQRFWGPRPWSARETSNDVPSVDVNKVLMRSREAVSRSRELPPTSSIIELVEKSSQHSPTKEGITSVLCTNSSGRASPQSGSPKEKCLDISFSPRSEEEEGEVMMEEKSITMLAYPMERRSLPRQSPEMLPNIVDKKYNSSTALDCVEARNNANKTEKESRHYNSLLGLSDVISSERATVEVNPVTQKRPLSLESVTDTKEKMKKSLQEQYADLEVQFSKWQKQLMDNERLLPVSQNEPMLTNEQKLARLKAEQNYMRLSTPKPFTHRATDPQHFKPRPVVKKPIGIDRSFLNQAAREDQQGSGESKDSTLTVHSSVATLSSDNHQSKSTDDGSPSQFQHNVGSSKPINSGRAKPRFEPKLDPREELMIAIRNAGGRKMLTKTCSMDNE